MTAIDREVLTYLTDITVQVKRNSYAESFCREQGYPVEIVE